MQVFELEVQPTTLPTNILFFLGTLLKALKSERSWRQSSVSDDTTTRIAVEEVPTKNRSQQYAGHFNPTMADDECAVHGVDTATLNELSDRLSESAEARVEGSDVDDQSTAEMQFGFFGNSASSAAAADPSALLPDFTNLDAETQERLQALLQAAGIAKAAQDGHVVPSAAMFADPEVLRRLSTSVSCALDEAADALTRMKGSAGGSASLTDSSADVAAADPSLAFGFTPNGAPVNVEDGESLLSLACSAGYYELAQVLLAMRTNIEDRGSKNDCTPLMEAASAGHFDIVKLLLAHGADSNAQSSTGNTPLMYACAGGHEDVVKALLESNADVEIRNENGHCPLMEAASAGHVNIAKYLVNAGASVQSVNAAEFKVGLTLTQKEIKGPPPPILI
uniref:Uncharacterized protein n=1 Tax=Plectus sambesii TaxID=2011161 RepID=A0A914X8U4_9BILA